MTRRSIARYEDFLPGRLLDALWEDSTPVAAVPGLRVAKGLREDFPQIETNEALTFVCDLYRDMRDELRAVLDQRVIDREFIDQEVAACTTRNRGRDYHSPEYETVIGKADPAGRIVVGPLPGANHQEKRVTVPEFLKGEQVTLFGPPDTEKMTINAMNALHRKPAHEADIIGRLLDEAGQVPRWGADNEDSKTPIMESFLRACQNLMGCFDQSLRFEDPETGKKYALAAEGLSTPIKRIPGLALPDGSHLFDGDPIPLHLYDFAMHIFHNWERKEALVFYVPKLENEEEARYLKTLIERAEERIQAVNPQYEVGTVKLFIVFENPRAIFRIQEIAAELYPYFVGGSLGWHDFLASTARLLKNDPNYRIPVKADPNIVINHIKESHQILVDALTPLGGIKIGGMYGILYEHGNVASYEVTMVGYIKDVVTQLKRGLDGFWVAHPDFVRPGLALVEAFRRWSERGDRQTLEEVITSLVRDEDERGPLLEFVFGDDVEGLPANSPLYLRGVLAADIETSDVIANHDPEEVRYNVFQALQYLADWLSGNGCVALPATMQNIRGETVFVRIMDDLATTERSRWELWAEVYHGRVSVELFDQILQEEYQFIQSNGVTAHKRVEVKWTEESARWYPIARKILRQLVVNDSPPEFASELLLPFTMAPIREAADPWDAARSLCPNHFDELD